MYKRKKNGMKMQCQLQVFVYISLKLIIYALILQYLWNQKFDEVCKKAKRKIHAVFIKKNK